MKSCKKRGTVFLIWLIVGMVIWTVFSFLYGFIPEPRLVVVFVWIPAFSLLWPFWLWFVMGFLEFIFRKAKIF